MSIAKVLEVTSQSTSSFDDAARNAIKEVSKTVDNVKHVWVSEFKIEVGDNGDLIYRTTCKVTFVLQDER